MSDTAADRAPDWGESTRLIRASLTPPVPGTPLHAGPVFAAPFHAPGEAAGVPYTYARSHNPTWTALEHTIAVLEAGAATILPGVRVFGSGLAAVAAVFGAVLRPGDVVVVPADSYFAARQLLREFHATHGVEVRAVPTAALGESVGGARLVWLESPSNPELAITDIAAVAAQAHAAGALVAVDNTTATPLGQRPLELGADLSVCSDSKAMCGASDLLLGHVATADAELLEKIDRWRTLTGAVAGPMEAWLLERSLSTLPLRLARTSETALALARFLLTRPEVHGVVYPGLPTHPGHAVAARQMRHFGPVLGFALAGQAAAESFFARTRLVTEATSFGGTATTAERRARWGHDAVEPGFIRLSAGLEDAADLLADLAQALDGLPTHAAEPRR